ncbi:MAG TPA: acyltransferase [Acidimicrobiales bacterium]|nr:acyltransferase [Acidimicrobiales bacterium]
MTGPDGAGAHLRYWPALDGVRALAVSVVVAYHLGYLPGGWLGVDVFFVLSGYLITTLLLRDHERTGSVVGLRFWARRAKRLLPAVFLLLVVLGVYAWVGGPGLVPAQLRSPALATFFYVANWQQLVAGHGYFAQFNAPSPLVHTWSLAIEEQYYVFWPFLLAAGVWVLGRRRGVTRALVAATVLAAAASAAWMGVAAHILSTNRAYLGTDTRGWELLLGGAAAMVWPAGGGARRLRGRPRTQARVRTREQSGTPAWAVASGVGLAVVGAVLARAGGPPPWIWDGGLVAAGVGSAALIVGVMRAPRGTVARVLGLAPLAWLGRISYSLYLWHWPVIVLVNQTTTGLSGAALVAARVALMLAATCASYYLVETPLRRADWRAWPRRALAPVGALGTAAVVVLGTAAPVSAGAAPVAHRPTGSAAEPSLGSVPAALPAGRVPSPSDPLRVWIMGDSVMFDSSAGLTAALQATGRATVTANSSFGGWGLSTDHVWPSDARRIINQYRPEVVIGTWSWDDGLAAADAAAYRARLEDAVRTILTPGDGVDLVVLLEYPPTGPSPAVADPVLRAAKWKQQLRVQRAWDDVARAVTGALPGHAAYLRMTPVFAPGGRLMTWMHLSGSSWIRARKLDNTHMCPYGAALFGSAVVTALERPLLLGDMAAGWETGTWTHDGRYNDPPGACPADQPPPGYAGIPLPVTSG